MLKRSSVVLFAVIALLAALSVAAADPDKESASDIWKQAPDSLMTMGAVGSTPNVESVRTEAINGGLKLALDMLDSNGKAAHAEFSVKYNGKDYPIAGLPDADAISLSRVDAYTFDCSFKKDGKVSRDERIVLSRDGTRAIFFKKEAGDPQQLNFTVVSVWDKQ